MKRVGNLWPSVLERENLVRAFHQAARGKRQKSAVRSFAENLDENLDDLRQSLVERQFETGQYHVFKVYDPKERTIHAARFPERVFHHALMNLCEPVLERQAVHHSYACRKGKGRIMAIEAAQKAARGSAWHLKLDIRKYFESIPQERLIRRLRRVFKDAEILYWFEKILRGHSIVEQPSVEQPSSLLGKPGFQPGSGMEGTAAGKIPTGHDRLEAHPIMAGEARGLPIGSLTSQHLANFYLGTLDRFCQALPGVKAYCRYMDDFVCWADEKAALLHAGRAIQALVEDELGLNVKHAPCPQRSSRGMDYLGYRIFPSHVELNRRSKVRYWRRLQVIAKWGREGILTQAEVQQRLTALTAFVLPARSWGFRCAAMGKFRSVAAGLEPGDPGW